MKNLSQPRIALALLATVGLCAVAGASESEPRRINAWVSVIDAPIPVDRQTTTVLISDISTEQPRADDHGGSRVDLDGRFPLGMGGFVDATGQLHSECSARTTGQRLRDRYIAIQSLVER